jgi:predicted acylesterase/phospholipase RssA
MAKLKPEEVKYVSFEGGGVAGLTIHPGVVETFESLGVLTYDAEGRQTNIRAFAGSSSGSVMATLTSVGYHHDEMAQLLSVDAFDMIFRLENLKLGEELKLNGVVKNRSNIPVSPQLLSLDALQTNFLGVGLEAVMSLQSSIEAILMPMSVFNGILSEAFFQRSNLIDEFIDSGVKNLYVREMAKAATSSLNNPLVTATVGLSKAKVLDNYRKYYAHAIYKLVDHLLNTRNNIIFTQNNLFKIFKEDYAPYAGVQWREYLANLVAFAAYRVNHPDVKSYLALPSPAEMRSTNSIRGLFLQKIAEAEDAALGAPGQSADDTSKVYNRYLKMSFEDHKDLFYPNLPAGISPLQITGANLSSQESHVFAAHTTPDLTVADAVRIASGVPPMFKPVILEAGDIPSNWGWARQTDRFGERPFMEGVWMDGGVFGNSPINLLMPYESGGSKALGVGIGISGRKTIANITQFYLSMVNVVYERNVSATLVGPDRYIEMLNFGIAMEKPKMTPAESVFYKAYGANEAFNYLMDLPGGSLAP